MFIARNNPDLARWSLDHWPRIFVPTMGALHDGHIELVRRATSYASTQGWSPAVVVSIFVNPTQFNDPADFQRYPQTFDADCQACEAAGATCIYAPSVDDIYPAGQSFQGVLPAVATQPHLEDAYRPGHFAGVSQVVERLFRLVQPAAAMFGEKDWQQLQVVRAMVQTLQLPIDIVGIPTVRESDGLAMSSRNRFLTPAQRHAGLALSRALAKAGRAKSPDAAEAAMAAELAAAGLTPDYAVVRNAASLLREPGATPDNGAAWRAIIAAKVGSVRLLDNAPWPGHP